jgi:NAD(P) transhydrogenase subunit alpha
MNHPQDSRAGAGPATRVGVPRERAPGERRVAMVPAVVARLRAAGLEVVVEAGAGSEALIPDVEFAL